MLATGVTVALPTLITADAPTLAERFHGLDRAVRGSRLGPLMVPGYHLEGPYLNPAVGYAGCHPATAMRPGSIAEVEALEAGLSRPIVLITVAPERPGVLELIAWATSKGKRIAIGHSAAEGEILSAAISAGATLSTHLGNGLPQSMPKFRNPLIDQLAADALTATIIADGIHVPRNGLAVLLRAKTLDRAILVTDAVSAAKAKPGLHPFAGMTVELSADGTVRTPGAPNLAGSSLALDQAVRNLVAFDLATPREALRLASANPRKVLTGPMQRHGCRLAASFVEWDTHVLAVRRVWLDGAWHEFQ